MGRYVVAGLAVSVALVLVAPFADATPNKCAAAKRVCVAKKAAALLGCHAKGAKPPGFAPEKLAACIQKVKAKFDGGATPTKGCFAKLEAKLGAACLTSGDTAAVEARVEAFVAATNCDLDPATCLPATCLDVREKAIAQGSALNDGSYTLYVARDLSRPWTAYCRSMSTSQPREYLTVDESDNHSQVSNGTAVTETSYRRYRIDPVTFVLDLLDDAFAETEGTDPAPPDGRSHIPAGWAEFGSPQSDDGPAAEAEIDVGGTGFAFAPSILADDLAFFCAVTNGTEAPFGDSQVAVANDLTSLTLSAIDPVAASTTRVVADCSHLGADEVTSASLPLLYVGE